MQHELRALGAAVEPSPSVDEDGAVLPGDAARLQDDPRRHDLLLAPGTSPASRFLRGLVERGPRGGRGGDTRW
jgi:hypothetical protein